MTKKRGHRSAEKETNRRLNNLHQACCCHEIASRANHQLKQENIPFQIQREKGLLLLRSTSKQQIYDYPTYRPSGVSNPDCPPAEHITQALLAHNLNAFTHHAKLPDSLLACLCVYRTLSDISILSLREHNRAALNELLQNRVPNQHIDESVTEVAGHWKCDVIQTLIRATNYIDEKISEDLTLGFPLVGNIPDGGIFSNTLIIKKANSQNFNDISPEYLKKMFAKQINIPDLHVGAIWKNTEDELESGRLSQIWEVDPTFSVLPFPGNCSVSPRFALQQNDKVRMIDNYSFHSRRTPSVNCCTTISHKVSLPTFDHVLEVIRLIRKNSTPEILHMSKLDHESAYRQLALLPDHRKWSRVLSLDPTKKPVVLEHAAVPFGASSSVTNYLRVSSMTTWLCRTVMFIPMLAYLDDFAIFDRATLSTSTFQLAMWFITQCTGGRLKISKSTPPSDSILFLGLQVELRPTQVVVRIHEDRARSYLEKVNATKINCRLLNDTLLGKLNFTCSALFGKTGRAQLRVLYNAFYSTAMKSQAVTQWDRPALEALQFFSDTFEKCLNPANAIRLARCLQMGEKPSKRILYSDAQTGQTMISGYTPSYLSQPPTYFACSVCVDHSLVTERETQIILLELCALIVSIYSLTDPRNEVVAFCDNTTVESIIQKGSSKSTDLNEIIRLFWSDRASSRFTSTGSQTIYFHRVSSSSNPADGPSRADMSGTWLRGATQVVPRFPVWLQRFIRPTSK